jgi:uncharacterized protein YjiS (DUF1127 family)
MNTLWCDLAPSKLSGRTRDMRELLAARLQAVLQVLLTAAERRRQRRALVQLDEHLLDDISVSAAQARQEVGKPFWRP